MNVYRLQSNDSMYLNSSGGQLLKWVVGNRYIKTSTLDTNSLQTKFMYESYAEVLVSAILDILGFAHVKYRLCKVEIDNSIQTIACESIDFKPKNYRDISFAKLMLMGKIPKLEYNSVDSYYNLIVSMKRYSMDITQYINQLILIDSLALNDDRHYGNFGLLVSSGQRQEVRVQPIFDNGNSLFCHKHTDELEYAPDLMGYLRCKPFSTNFNMQLNLVKDIHRYANKLGLVRKEVPNILAQLKLCGLPDSRSKFIQDLLYSRIDYITNISSI